MLVQYVTQTLLSQSDLCYMSLYDFSAETIVDFCTLLFSYMNKGIEIE